MENISEKKWTTKPKIVKKCFICSQHFDEQNLDRHMHSFDHHKAIEQMKGSKWAHKCWACNISVTGLQQYKRHIATCEHKENLLKLQEKRHQKVKLSVDYTADLNAKPNTLHSQRKQKKSRRKCFVCRHSFIVQDLDKHMHSFAHHSAIEKLKGSNQVHKCWACDISVTGLQQYKKHVSTGHHKHMMYILNERTDDEKNTMYYGVEFKELCAQRDKQIFLNKRKRLLKRRKAKKAIAEQKAQEKKVIQNCQTKNESRSICLPIPDMAGEDFTSDELTTCNLFSSWEEQQNASTSRANQNMLNRRQESLCDMDHLNCLHVKRSCPPSEIIAQEMSCSTRDGEMAGVCANSSTSNVKLCASVRAPEPLQRDYSHISTLFEKSLDNQDVTIASGVNVRSPTKEVIDHSNHKKRLNERPNERKQHRTKKKRQVKGKNSKQKSSSASLSSVTSLNEMIRAFRHQTSATPTEDTSQIIEFCGNEPFRTDPDTDREKINTEQAETLHLNSFQTISCNIQKFVRKKQDILDTTLWNPETTSKQNNVNKLMTVSSREEELTNSLRNVGDQLFQAYASLKSAYTEVQHLLTVKQQVTSQMATLRAERIQILQDMMNPASIGMDIKIPASPSPVSD